MIGKRTKISGIKRSGIVFATVFLVFPILQFLVFYVGVNIKAWLSAFQIQSRGVTSWSFVNFRLFFLDLQSPVSNMSVILKNTFITFFVYDFISLPLCVLFSYVLFKKIVGQNFFRIIFYVPSLISIVALTLVFYYFVDVKGPVGALLGKMGVPYPSPFGSTATAFLWVMIYCVWSGLGYSIILLSGVISRLPAEIFESARIEGCGMAREFFSIVLPLLAPTISMLFILNFASAFGMWGPVQMLTSGNYGSGTIGFYIFKQAQNDNYNYPSAVGLLVSAFVVPIVLLLKKLSERFTEEITF